MRLSLTERIGAAVVIVVVLSLVIWWFLPRRPAIAARPPESAFHSCNPANCRITVTMNDCANAAMNVLDPASGNVSMAASGAMRWQIASSGNGYAFAENGIEFVPPTAHFDVAASQGGRPVFVVVNKHDEPASAAYEYVVHVKQNNTDCAPIDPWILNN